MAEVNILCLKKGKISSYSSRDRTEVSYTRVNLLKSNTILSSNGKLLFGGIAKRFRGSNPLYSANF